MRWGRHRSLRKTTGAATVPKARLLFPAPAGNPAVLFDVLKEHVGLAHADRASVEMHVIGPDFVSTQGRLAVECGTRTTQ